MVLRKIIINIRNIIFDLYEKKSITGKIIIRAWNLFHNLKFRYNTYFIELKRRKFFPNEKLYQKFLWINPKKIKFFIDDEELISMNLSLVTDINFSQFKKPIEDLTDLQFITKKKIEKKDWNELNQYSIILNKLRNGENYNNIKNKNELDNTLILFENLLDQKENLEFDDVLNQIHKANYNLFNDISIVIDEFGQIILLNRKLSFALLKFLNIPKIPVIVLARHENWIETKKELINFSLNYKDKKLYQPLTHPDLQLIPSKYGDLRFNIIKENLSLSKGTLLDIGANLGYFCQKFEELGFQCYAVEYNKIYVNLMKKLKKAEIKQFEVFEGSIFSYKADKELDFDIIIALNIFHHFLKRKNVFENFTNLLNRLKVKELFFEAHNPEEFSNKRVYKNFTSEQFINFLIQNSCLTKARLLYEFDNGRKIYKLISNLKFNQKV